MKIAIVLCLILLTGCDSPDCSRENLDPCSLDQLRHIDDEVHKETMQSLDSLNKSLDEIHRSNAETLKALEEMNAAFDGVAAPGKNDHSNER